MAATTTPPVDADTAPGPHDREPGFLLLAHALMGGPAIWIVHLVSCAALVGAACAHDLTWLINLDTALSAVVAITAIASAVYIRRRLVSAIGSFNGRTRSLMTLGIVFGSISLLLILLEGAPVLFLDACTF